jgi:diguanylate cyclase (GGDEF)-like protein
VIDLLTEVEASRMLFAGLPVPACLIDEAGRLVALNRRAAAFWRLDLENVAGRPALAALGIGSLPDAAARSGRRACRLQITAGPPGVEQPVSLLLIPLEAPAFGLTALIVVPADAGEVLERAPEWALCDALTGLGNRHRWEREIGAWRGRQGSVVFLDLDNLKELNDRWGHAEGDRALALVGRALAEALPAGALAVRYGGDEFVAVLPAVGEEAAEAWADGVRRTVAQRSAEEELGTDVRLSYGVAVFGPVPLEAAMHVADARLYARKRASRDGRGRPEGGPRGTAVRAPSPAGTPLLQP